MKTIASPGNYIEELQKENAELQMNRRNIETISDLAEAIWICGFPSVYISSTKSDFTVTIEGNKRQSTTTGPFLDETLEEVFRDWPQFRNVALPISNMIRVNVVVLIEGETVAEVDCADYDEYKKLPVAIKINDKVLGKSGWSSDKNFACYKENILLGQILDIKA